MDHLADGDRARVIFNPPRFENSIEISSAEGPVLAVAGMRYIQDETHRRAWAMPTILDLAGADVESVEVLEAADEIARRKACEARGDLVFPDLPDDPVEHPFGDIKFLFSHCLSPFFFTLMPCHAGFLTDASGNFAVTLDATD